MFFLFSYLFSRYCLCFCYNTTRSRLLSSTIYIKGPVPAFPRMQASALFSPFFVGTMASSCRRAELHKASAGIAGSPGEIAAALADRKAAFIFVLRSLLLTVHHGKEPSDVPLVLRRVQFLQKAPDTMFFHSFLPYRPSVFTADRPTRESSPSAQTVPNKLRLTGSTASRRSRQECQTGSRSLSAPRRPMPSLLRHPAPQRCSLRASPRRQRVPPRTPASSH